MDKIINNSDKREVYRMLMGSLKVAICKEFWYEAIFLEYAILEDRLHSILEHNGKISSYNMANNIKKITNIIMKNKKGVEKYFSKEILSELDDWRRKRNVLVHTLATLKYDDSEVKKVAQEGYVITKEISNRATNYRRYLCRRKLSST